MHFSFSVRHFCLVHIWNIKVKRRLLEPMTQIPTFASWSELISHDVSFPDLSHSYDENTESAWVSSASGECSADNELRALLTLLSLLTVVVCIDSAFHNATTAWIQKASYNSSMSCNKASRVHNLLPVYTGARVPCAHERDRWYAFSSLIFGLALKQASGQLLFLFQNGILKRKVLTWTLLRWNYIYNIYTPVIYYHISVYIWAFIAGNRMFLVDVVINVRRRSKS